MLGVDLLKARLIELAFGFVWDVAQGSYISKATGDSVPESLVLNWSQGYVTNVRLNIQDVTKSFIDGDLTLQQWQGKMATEIKDGWIVSSAIGRGGRNAMEHSDWGRTGGRLRFEYSKLNQFAADIEMGDLTDAMIIARAELYANATRTGYFDGLTHAKMAAGYTHEQRFLGIADHCDDCVFYANQGLQPIGTLPEPGEACVCMRNCKCTKEYYTPKDAESEQKSEEYIDYEAEGKKSSFGFTDLSTLEKNYSEWENTLGRHHTGAIQEYTRTSYWDINKYLRGDSIWEEGVEASRKIQLSQYMNHMDDAFTHAPGLDTPTVFYRGFRSSDMMSVLDDGTLLVGDVIIEPSYLSTSALESAAYGFGDGQSQRIVYKIQADAGSRGMYVGTESLSNYVSEAEFLFPKGTSFEVLAIDNVSEIKEAVWQITVRAK